MPLLKRAVRSMTRLDLRMKMDGFRALAMIEHGRAQLLSRNGHPFAAFADLGSKRRSTAERKRRSSTAKFAPWSDVAGGAPPAFSHSIC